jgi:hypothetical protein
MLTYSNPWFDGVTFALVFVGAPTALIMLLSGRRLRSPHSNHRSLYRTAAKSAVNVFLGERGPAGQPLPGRAIEISEYGASIRMEQELPPGSVVFLAFPQYQLMGSASVKRCARSGKSYIVGVAFLGAMMKSIH